MATELKTQLSHEGMMLGLVPVVLPSDLKTWLLVQGVLSKLSRVSTTQEMLPILDHIYDLIHNGSAPTNHSPFHGLVHFLETIASQDERDTFFRRILPTMVDLAFAVGDLKPKEGFFYSMQQKGGETRLSRRFVASLVAHMMLCTLPRTSNPLLNSRDFERFYYILGRSKGSDSQTCKMRCFLHYFDRLAVDMHRGPCGSVTFKRKVIPEQELPSLETWQESRLQLCPLVVQTGVIEEAGSNVLQVDFANEYIGGGVLGSGCVQEEIRFSICPELLASMVFMECMEDNEAIFISGFEQFSRCHGYGWNLQYAGDHRDVSQTTSRGDIKTSLVAIDATPMNQDLEFVSYQYSDPSLLRELNKAFVGFLQAANDTGNGIGPDLSDSLYMDAIDQSLLSTEGDFETASEGLESLNRPATPCMTTISDYSNSLSKAITDIAVKDYCQSKRNQFTQCELSLVEDSVVVKNTGEDLVGGRLGLESFASTVVGEVMKESFESASRNPTSKKVCGTKEAVSTHSDKSIHRREEGFSSSQVRTNVSNFHRSSQQEKTHFQDSVHRIWKGGNPTGNMDGVSQSLREVIDDIVCGVIKEALAEIAGSYISETESTQVPSLEGYSIVSTWSSKSDSFVRIDMDSDFSGTRSGGSMSSASSDKCAVSVETYVAGVVAGAVHQMRREDASEKGDRGVPSSTPNVLAGKIVNGALREIKDRPDLIRGSDLQNSYFKPVVSAGLDSFATHVADAAFRDALTEVSDSVPLTSYDFSQYSTIPSTPPPSPSNASTGSSKRFSLEDPSQLEEFAEKLLSSITPDPSASMRDHVERYDVGSQGMQGIEDFASTLVSRAVSDSAQLISSSSQTRQDSSSGCVSSRSSLTVPSGSSKRSSVDSFTEDLLRIGNIDPTGRRPSKTEENIAFFSQELSRVAEVEEKLSQRRKSDLEDFQQELYQSSLSSNTSQKNEVTKSRVHAAHRLANRLSDDIICDAFLQLYGATPFRELIRLDSLSDLESGGGSRRRSYPRRGYRTSSVSSTSLSVRSTISEMDLMTLATNLANSIIESALQTYREEYLSMQRQGAPQEMVDDEQDSRLQDTVDDVSLMATYDGSTIDRDLAPSYLEEPSDLSVEDAAGSIVARAVQDAVFLYKASLPSTSGGTMHPGGSRIPVATGNWGCGAFGGDPQLKSLLQWLAASQSRAPSVLYYTFNNNKMLQLEQVTLMIQTRRWSVGDVMRVILEYCHHVVTSGEAGSLFDYILGLEC
ncbi:uncharacterized protein [Diadema antillarum]|uniref:uncharacterized protein n=1 Tax=Diadema antillarum TaxID=105358 RepID=UPI003A88F176